MKIDSLSNCSKNELCSTFVPMIASTIKRRSKLIFEQCESESKFILNTWLENSPKICNALQPDQSSFRMHIQHVIRSSSHTWLDQISYPGYLIFLFQQTPKRSFVSPSATILALFDKVTAYLSEFWASGTIVKISTVTPSE